MRIGIIGWGKPKVENIGDLFPEGAVVDEIICGGARSIVSCAKRYARTSGIACVEICSDSSRYGEFASAVRNLEIITASDHVILCSGASRVKALSAENFCRNTGKSCTATAPKQ